MTRKAVAAVLVAAMLLSTGCWEYRTINSLAMALGMAIDAEGEEGLLVTLQFPLPGLMKGGGAGGTPTLPEGQRASQFFLIEGRGASFAEALADAQRSMSRPMSFGHLQVVLLGAKLLQQGAADLFEQLVRFAELDKLSYLLVVREGQAAEALAVVPPQERLPARFLGTAMDTRIQVSTLSKPSTLLQSMVLGLEPGRDLMATAVTVRENELYIDSLAVFRGPHLAVILSPEESRALLMARGEVRNASLTLPRPGGGVWAYRRLSAEGTRLTMETKQGRPLMRIRVKVAGEAAGASGRPIAISAAELAKMEQALAARLSGEIKAVMEQLQKLRVEPLGFFARQNPYLPNDEQWRGAYSRGRFDVVVTVQLHRRGVLK